MPRALLPKAIKETAIERDARRVGLSIVKLRGAIRFWFDDFRAPLLHDFFEGGELFTARNAREADAYIQGFWDGRKAR